MTINDYAIEIRPLEEQLGGGYEALFPQFSRGVVGYGATPKEAFSELLAAAPAFLEALAEMGQPLPVPERPKEGAEFSGKFNVRVPRMLHAKLVRQADEQGVSLNSLVQTILSSGSTALESGHEFGSLRQAAPGEHIDTTRRKTRRARMPARA